MTTPTENELREKLRELLQKVYNAGSDGQDKELLETDRYLSVETAMLKVDNLFSNLHRQQGIRLPKKKKLPAQIFGLDLTKERDIKRFSKNQMDFGYNQAITDVIALNKDGGSDG